MTDKAWEDRQTKRIPLPPTDQELDDHNQWAIEYAALRDQGFERDWLDVGAEGYIHRGPKPSGHEERPETDEEYEKRMKSPFARAMWEMSRSILKDFRESSEILKQLNTDNATQTVFRTAKRGDL